MNWQAIIVIIVVTLSAVGLYKSLRQKNSDKKECTGCPLGDRCDKNRRKSDCGAGRR